MHYIESDRCTPEEFEMIKEFIEGFWGIKVPSLCSMECLTFGRLLSPGHRNISDVEPEDLQPTYHALRRLREHATRTAAEGRPFKTHLDLLGSFSNWHLFGAELSPYEDEESIRSIEFLKEWQLKKFGKVFTFLEEE